MPRTKRHELKNASKSCSASRYVPGGAVSVMSKVNPSASSTTLRHSTDSPLGRSFV
jgi:hypothetical protein